MLSTIEKFDLLPIEQQKKVLEYIEALFAEYQQKMLAEQLIEVELRTMNNQEILHLEQEFENYENLYPYES